MKEVSARKSAVGTISVERLADVAFVLYFSTPLIRLILRFLLLSWLNSRVISVLAVIPAYITVIMVCIVAPRRYIKFDFIMLLAGVVLFFALSLLFHPEYEEWYTRSGYGVWDFVLTPSEGLYAYLFVRIVGDPVRIKNNMKTAGWIMMLCFAYQIYTFLQRGYWIGIAGQNNMVHMDHSVSTGYSILLFSLFFLYDVLKEKKASDIVGATLLLGMVLFCGTRGPFICALLFVALYVTAFFQNSKRKPLLIASIAVAGGAIYLLLEPIMLLLERILIRLGSSARIISTLFNGSFTNDSGRYTIWKTAAQMIHDNPWGHGAMGSQPVISKLIYVGYPHSIVLEMLIDFGVIVGTILLAFLFINAGKMLFKKDNARWFCAFLPFFATSCQLLISLCFWTSTPFWASVGVGVCSAIELRRRKKSFC